MDPHERARVAIAEGRFEDEVEPVTLPDGMVIDTDECPRETSLAKMAGLEPLARRGRITAAVASRTCDASAAMLIASAQAVRDHGLTPWARIHHVSVRAGRSGVDAHRPHPRDRARPGPQRTRDRGQANVTIIGRVWRRAPGLPRARTATGGRRLLGR